MSQILPFDVPDLVSDAAHRWREFYLLVTLELRSIDHLLTLVAQSVCAAADATACVISHVSLRGQHVLAHGGAVSEQIWEALTDIDRTVAQGHAVPVYQTHGWARIVSLPLASGRDSMGMLYIINPAEPYDLSEFQFATVLLSNALRRQYVSDQFVLAERRHVEQGLAVQYAVTSVLAESSTLDEAIPRLLRTVGERLHCDVGVLWTVDHQTASMQCSGFWHTPAVETGSFEEDCRAATFREGEGLPGRVWATHAPVVIPNLVRDPDFPRVIIAAGLHGALGFPITHGNTVSGVLEYFSRGMLAPDANELALMSTIGNQIGQFIERKRSEDALHAIDRQFRATFEQAAVGMAHVGLDGSWRRVNERLCQITGYRSDELLQRSHHDITHAEDRESDLADVQRLLNDEIQNYATEKRYVRKDGSVVWVELTMSLMRDVHGTPMHFIAVVEDITERRHTEAENQRLYKELRTERDRLITREVEVRAQIGRDLHDGPVQQVAVATMEVQHARRVAQRELRRLPEALNDLENQLKRCTHDLRNVLYELRPLGITEDGLEGVLRQYVERFRDPSGLRIHLQVPDRLRRVDVDHESAAFIIVQEAVNNARKHAQAQDIWIDVREQNDGLAIEVRDNGRGFDLEAARSNYIKRGSFGLLNMRERAQLIGGMCDLRSQPGLGTTVTIHVPF